MSNEEDKENYSSFPIPTSFPLHCIFPDNSSQYLDKDYIKDGYYTSAPKWYNVIIRCTLMIWRATQVALLFLFYKGNAENP
jgi:hypothetical protein